jgi:hypothetical protein
MSSSIPSLAMKCRKSKPAGNAFQLWQMKIRLSEQSWNSWNELRLNFSLWDIALSL